jgi:hypothetical protein
MSYLETDRIERRRALAGVACVALQIYMGSVLTGCAREPAEEAAPLREVAEVIVEPAQLTLQAGGEAWLAGQANDSTGQPVGGAKLQFRQADPHFLSVSQQGLVTSLGPATVQTHVVVASGGQERLVPVVVLCGPPQRMEKLSGNGQEIVAGQSPAEPVMARLVDAWGNPLGGVAVTVRSATDLFPAGEAVTAADGTLRFDVPRLTLAGTAVVVVEADAGTGPVESFQFEVRPGPASDVSLASPTAADAARPDARPAVTLVVVDAFGNPVPDVEVVARFAAEDPPPAPARTDSAGSVLVFVPPATRPGPMTLEVALPAVPDFRRTLTVDPGPQPASGVQEQGA